MDWMRRYDLFLFDFDGLLVNTEHLHFEAYVRMCRRRGVELTWDFSRYCMAAHFESTGIRDQMFEEFPEISLQEPEWERLYKEKKSSYMELLHEGAVRLMPGAEDLLLALQEEGIKRCVVTHSSLEQVEAIRKQNPILNTIPRWFTREDYSHPKPHPECYLKAIESLVKDPYRVVGFEDSPRGLKALKASPADAVFISSIQYPNQEEILKGTIAHYESLTNLFAVQDNLRKP